MALVVAFGVIHGVGRISKPMLSVRAQSVDNGDSRVALSSSVNALKSAVGKIDNLGLQVNGRNEKAAGFGSLDKEKKEDAREEIRNELQVLYDDGYGSTTVKNYLDAAADFIKPDGGQPRWFCPVECGRPITDSPTLLFLPGLDGIGLGLMLHHKALGKAFEVRCLHIPVTDRTPFEGLVDIVEEAVRIEHASSPKKPVYLVGDSFGGCLALAVAARNRDVDLVIILVNPATSFGQSQMQHLLPILESLPNELNFTVPYLLSFVMGDPLKMASVNIETRSPPAAAVKQLSSNLSNLLPEFSVLSSIIPKETILWKMKLISRAATYANSRLHAIKAEVLVLASGKDGMLPSAAEAQRLSSSIQNCRVRNFEDNGHALLLEDGINLMAVIKGTSIYRRRSRVYDHIKDFLPPSKQEFKFLNEEVFGTLSTATSPVMFSTMEDGSIVRSLAGVPSDGPVLLVGYHMLMGLEMVSLALQFMKEKKVVVRGLAHPDLLGPKFELSLPQAVDMLKACGALPVTGSNLFKLLSTNSHVLLYPGGVREALHRRGEQYKLFWPEQAEFVRMAARFGATIVPFGAVGEDDLLQLVLDYDDMLQIPILNDYVRETTRDSIKVRDESAGEVANGHLHLPGVLPKLPGRLYYLFGKPIVTKGQQEALKDKEAANEMFLQVKYEVEKDIAYLLRKREEDPFRGIVDRTIYGALYPLADQMPTFEP